MEKKELRIISNVLYCEDDYKIYEINVFNLNECEAVAQAYVLAIDSGDITSWLLAEADSTSTTIYDTLRVVQYAVKKGILEKGPTVGIMWAFTEENYRGKGVFKAMLEYITEKFGNAVVLRFAPTMPERVLELPEEDVVKSLNARFNRNFTILKKNGWKIIPSNVALYANNEFAAKTFENVHTPSDEK